MIKICFNRKRPGYDQRSEALSETLRTQLDIDAKLTLYIGYEIIDLDPKLYPNAVANVFSEVMTDEVMETLPMTANTVLAREPLPGQYDQRSDAAEQCLRLLDFKTHATVKTFEVVVFDRQLDETEQSRFLAFWINPIELRVKHLGETLVTVDPVSDEGPIAGFLGFSEGQALAFLKKERAAMSLEDYELIRKHFKTIERRNPTRTEFKILDTYWSDHCRHTTFETKLNGICIPEGPFTQPLSQAMDKITKMREVLGRMEKPLTLMELATIYGRYLNDPRVEISEEINACSVRVKIQTETGPEDWLLQFKNETHNHPTEIEPFGGASTCIGGAIRDPLSGRAYVYQAMRISGCGNVKEKLEETLSGKLPQRVIATRATQGNSAYGNQIGVATTFVKEIYHPSYQAKHLELGAVVGAVKASAVRRETPNPGDVIVLLGGRTGRDGIGGATGSSQAHTSKSLTTCASEVQKGNAPEERKLQRLFRNPKASTLIKKCNDFGAGGVSVAIGELAPGLDIDLDVIPVKYLGLNATELAISESQERMAVVLEAKDLDEFLELATMENLEATKVATVTREPRLKMHFKGKTVADLDRALIDTNGHRQSTRAILKQSSLPDRTPIPFNESNALEHLASLNVALQKGLIEQFDASIGATTVLFPLGGKDQSSPTQGSVQTISIPDKTSTSVSILTYGFIPELSETNMFISAQAAVLQSIAKTIALGGQIDDIFFSIQEYFPKLGHDARKWGQVVQALLGAFSVQEAFRRPAIGGKDSMSGSFKNLDVLDTLVCFACTKAEMEEILPQVATETETPLYVVKPRVQSDGSFDLEMTVEVYRHLEKLIRLKQVKAVRVIEESLFASVCALIFGNAIQAEINMELDLLSPYHCAFLVAGKPNDLPLDWHYIGKTSTSAFTFNQIKVDYDQARKAYLHGLDFLYPVFASNPTMDPGIPDTDQSCSPYPFPQPDEVRVVIPYFPGTNCEDDTARAFLHAGAKVQLCALRNLGGKDLKDSLHDFAQALDQAHILALPGGFSSGDEPDGSAKFIVNVLRNAKIKTAIEGLLKRGGLILGICNGFQALIKTGLLPYGDIRELDANDATLTHNTLGRHISAIASTRLTSNASPWLNGLKPGKIAKVPLSHGEGRLRVNPKQAEEWARNGQIAFQYCDPDGQASMDPRYNLNGSDYAIEGLISPDGRILGKMGHSERVLNGLYKNIPDMEIFPIIQNGVDYFKKR